MTTTRTGGFPVGFRRGWSDWQKDLDAVIRWAKDNAFACLDVGPLPAADLQKITAAGLKLGTVDLPKASELVSPDAGKRKDAAARIAAYVKDVVALPGGPRNFFTVMAPEDDARKRSENLEFATDGYNQLCAAIESLPGDGAHIVLEGYPGGPPRYAILACTPADYRLVFERIPSRVMGVNFDPSHLIRMGIDPVRFLHEFAPRVHHVHGKDTEILDDELYEHGNLQPATLARPHGFGAHAWRYTIPGHGCARWTKLLSILKERGYRGMISIELEDENFNGTEDGEKRGLLASRDFLASA